MNVNVRNCIIRGYRKNTITVVFADNEMPFVIRCV